MSWVILYLFFPSWRFPNTLGDQVMINLFVGFFFVSAWLVNRCFNILAIDKPLIARGDGLAENIRDNVWFVLACCLSAAVHLSTLPPVNVLGETIMLRQTFWLYDFMNSYWHNIFDFPAQYFFLPLPVVSIFLVTQRKAFDFFSNIIDKVFSGSNKLTLPLVILALFGVFNLYAYFFPYYSAQEAMDVVRFPPVSRLLYLFVYSVSGLSMTGPRVVQLLFYLLGALYLYRTLLLFHKKDVALLGAVIYLFSPTIFTYASTAALSGGTVFFVTIISFYFLRFLKESDERDIVLTAYCIGIGFMYKRVIVVMFIICFGYLLLKRLKERDLGSIKHFAAMLLSLVFVLPWLRIGPSVYKAIWTNLIVFEELITYAMMVQSQMSWLVFILLLFSFCFSVFYKRDDLLLFFGLLFITYYVCFTLMEVGKVNYRYAMTFYPAIAVFLSRFIFSISQMLRTRYAFAVLSAALSVYLVFMCVIPRSGSALTTYRYKDFELQYYPFDKATEWFRANSGPEEQVASLFMLDYIFYVGNIYEHSEDIDPARFRYLGNWALTSIYPLDNLKEYCYEKDISYIMIPYNPRNAFPSTKRFVQMNEMEEYFRENMESDSDFTKVADFRSDDNYLLIYRLMERPSNTK